jgi:predicted peptidase
VIIDVSRNLNDEVDQRITASRMMHRLHERWMVGILIFAHVCAWTSRPWNMILLELNGEQNDADDVSHLSSTTDPGRRAVLTRTVIATMPAAWTMQCIVAPSNAVEEDSKDEFIQSKSLLQIIRDQDSYSALSYSPPRTSSERPPPPLIVVLHGAGKNDLDIMQDLADPRGEHAGLIPSLIEAGQAPTELLDNFAVLAPYSYGKASFYQDPRSTLLKCIENASTQMDFDPNRIFLFGFSDGATVAVELMTTGRFAGAVVCSYGYSGTALPSYALERLSGRPMWVFHSADDVIFNVHTTSDRLVQQLRQVASSPNDNNEIIRYTRYEYDPEHLPARVRGHSMGITASKMPEVYTWMLNLPPRRPFT